MQHNQHQAMHYLPLEQLLVIVPDQLRLLDGTPAHEFQRLHSQDLPLDFASVVVQGVQDLLAEVAVGGEDVVLGAVGHHT